MATEPFRISATVDLSHTRLIHQRHSRSLNNLFYQISKLSLPFYLRLYLVRLPAHCRITPSSPPTSCHNKATLNTTPPSAPHSLFLDSLSTPPLPQLYTSSPLYG